MSVDTEVPVDEIARLHEVVERLKIAQVEAKGKGIHNEDYLVELSKNPQPAKLDELIRDISDAASLGVASDTVGFLCETSQPNLYPHLPSLVTALGRAMHRRSERNEPLNTVEELQLTTAFDVQSAPLDRMRRQRDRASEHALSAAIANALVDNPQYIVAAHHIHEEFFRSDAALDEKAALMEQAIPLEQALAIIKKQSGRDNDNWKPESLNVLIRAIGGKLRTRKESENELNFNRSESAALMDTVRQLTMHLHMLRSIDRDLPEEQFVIEVQVLVDTLPELAGIFRPLVNQFTRRPGEQLIAMASRYAPSMTSVELQQIIIAGKTEEMLNAFRRLKYMYTLFQQLDGDGRTKLERGLSTYTAGHTDQTRQQFLEALFTMHGTNKFLTDLDKAGVTLANLPDYLSEDFILQVADYLCNDISRYRIQLGTLLAQIPIERIPDSIAAKLQPSIANLDFELKMGHNGWGLCPVSEEKLQSSMDHSNCILVNNVLLAKVQGKQAALCLQTVTNRAGFTFLAGNWYSPTDQDTRALLCESFIGKKAKLNLDKGTWVLMRPVTKEGNRTPKEFLDAARSYAMLMGDEMPDIYGKNRAEYYREVHEAQVVQ